MIESRVDNIVSFIPEMLRHIQEISDDSFRRISCYKEGRLPEGGVDALLESGIWYPNDYYRALKRFDQTAKVSDFASKGHFFHGFAPLYFEQPADDRSPTKIRTFCYKITPHQLPSVALEQIGKTVTFMDCTQARQLAAYRALQGLLSKEKFDHIFSYHSPFALVFGDDNATPLRFLFKEMIIRDESELLPGDFVHFSSIADYVPKHPGGDSRGYNVICQRSGAQYLGLGLSPKGESALEVEHTLYRAYNSDPVDEEYLPFKVRHYFYTQFLARNFEVSKREVDLRKTKQITFEQFQAEPSRLARQNVPVKGKLRLIIARPDLERIEQIRKAPLEQIRNVFERFASTI